MKQKLGLKEKVQKEMPEFADEVGALSSEELNNRLAQLAKQSEQVQDAKEADEELEKARAEVSCLAAPHNDASKAIRLKSRYIIALLKDKGE